MPAWEILAPSMNAALINGRTYPRRRGVMVPQDVECLLTSKFGVKRAAYGDREHTGSDWAIADGTPAVANCPPSVVEVAANSFNGYGWGYFVVLRFADRTDREWLLLLGHLKYRPIVVRGNRLKRDDTVGFVDSTGVATGSHHHITIGLAEDFDSGKEGIDRYAEFWRSPRDDDGGVARLWDAEAFMVDELSQSDAPPPVTEGERMGYHELVLAMTDAYFPFYEGTASARLEVRWNEETKENEHIIRLSLEDQRVFNERYQGGQQ